MAISSCLDDQFHGDEMPYITDNIIIIITGMCLNLFVRLYVYYVENIDKIPADGIAKHVSYGFGAKGVAKGMSSLGLAFSAPQLILWFITRGINHDNSLEFACQVQAGFSFIPPLTIGYMVFVLFLTNYMRFFTRHSFARVVMDYINPVGDHSIGDKSSDDGCLESTTRIAILPAYRGIWFTPIIHQFLEKMEAKTTSSTTKRVSETDAEENVKIPSYGGAKYEFIALDCYNSIYNPECSDWLATNMRLEGVDMRLFKIVWTNFKHIPLADNSLDSLLIPIGALIPYLSLTMGTPGEESQEEKHTRTVAFLKEIKRILKPRGTLIASNMSFHHSGWVKALDEAGFVDVTCLSDKVWWTYLPATVVVAHKGEGKNNSGEVVEHSVNEPEKAVESGRGGGEVVLSPVHHTDQPSAARSSRDDDRQTDEKTITSDRDTTVSSAAPSFSTFDVVTIDHINGSNNHRLSSVPLIDNRRSSHSTRQRSRSFSGAVEAGGEYIRSLNNILCPSGWNFRLVEFLLLTVLLFYLGFVTLSVTLLDRLQVPNMLPYDQMFSALFINNCLYIPIVLFSMVGDLRQAAATEHHPAGTAGSPDGTFGAPHGMSELARLEHQTKQRALILKIFQKHLVNILIVVTIVTVLGWVPFAVLDLLLIEVFGQSDRIVGTVNIAIGLGVIMVLVPVATRLYAWYKKREYQQQIELKALLLGEDSSVASATVSGCAAAEVSRASGGSGGSGCSGGNGGDECGHLPDEQV